MDTPTMQRMHRRAVRGLIAAVGVVLVAPALAVSPAQAATPDTGSHVSLLDPVTTVQPWIDGPGTITSDTGYNCTLAGTIGVPQLCTETISLGGLTGLTQTTLIATPADGFQFAGWDDACPAPDASNGCPVDTSLLGALLGSTVSPTAAFTELPPIPIPCDPIPTPGCTPADTTPPNTEITTSPPVGSAGRTHSRDATFAFTTTEPEAGATFMCKLTGPSQAHDYTDCTTAPASGATTSSGTKEYADLVPGNYVFAVHASDANVTPNQDMSDATFTWTIVADTTAPDTTITQGPKPWLLNNFASLAYHASDNSAEYACRLDGTSVSSNTCGSGHADFLHFASGTHTFSVAAIDASGNKDSTPATRTFTVPRNNNKLQSSSRWTNLSARGHFLDTYSITTKKGAWITQGSKKVKKIALVVTKGKGYGTVRVYLGKQLLKKVSLAASRTKMKQLIPVASFARAKRGTIRIVVVTKGMPVVIEGLGIASR